MSERYDELVQSIREEASEAAWSLGVRLSRGGGARIRRVDASEIEVVVQSGGGLVSPTVSLWLDDLDYQCDCRGAEDACAHVVAAALCLRDASRTEGAVPKPSPAPQPSRAAVGYRFKRAPSGLAFERVITTDSGETPLSLTLSRLVLRGGPSRVHATKTDFTAEAVLGTLRGGVLPKGVLASLLKVLDGSPHVRLDGKPVEVSSQPVLPVAKVEDHPEGFRLQVVPDPAIEAAFDNGAALVAGVLRPVGEHGLSARELEELPRGRIFRPSQVAELMTSVVPSLRARMPVQILARRLPDETRVPPHIDLRVEADGETLSVLATLLYGDPPVARVDQGELVLLGAGRVPIRDVAAERQLVRKLEATCGLAPGRRVTATGEGALALAARLGQWEGAPQRPLAAFYLAPALEAQVRIHDGGVDLDFVPMTHDGAPGRGHADPARVMAAWRAGESLVPLSEGGWAPIPRDWLDRFGDQVADLLAARQRDGSLPKAVSADVARLAQDLDVECPRTFAALAALTEDFDGLGEPRLPADLEASLRGYQAQGVAWLQALGAAGLGALLADDMGLGKTLQVLAAVRGRTLVVAPTSVLHNWALEAARFRPGLSVSVYHGPRRTLDPTADLTLTTYAVARIDQDVLGAVRWGTVVLDEAQAIKNPQSQVARAVFRLDASWRVALTGTPVENRLDELWSQLHFANPGLLGGLSDFQRRYAEPIAAGEPGAAERLRRRIRPFVLRRLKRDVARELPPRTDMVLHCALSDEERKVYDAVRAATRDEVVQRLREGGNVLAALEALLRLRQAACHRGLVPGQEAPGSSKVELLMEILDEAVSEDHKVLVFSQWTSLLDRIEPHLEAQGVAWARLDGTTRDRGAVVETFQSDDGPPVMLLSLKAGGTGLNLTAADLVVLMDPWWNPAVEDQAADRAHRIGQDRPVLVYRIVAEDTVEERILALQQHKRQLADAALGDAGAAASLSRDDLLALLE
jgi:superfamily II DNA or RNA helicase